MTSSVRALDRLCGQLFFDRPSTVFETMAPCLTGRYAADEIGGANSTSYSRATFTTSAGLDMLWMRR